MTELAEKLPWREELEQFEDRLRYEDHPKKRRALRLLGHRFPGVDAKRHADRLIANAALPKKALKNPKKTRDDLILGLERAALYYWFGQSVDDGIKHNATLKHESIAPLLKMPPKHRMERYEDSSFIWVMAVTWEHLGGKAGTATFPQDHEKAGAETPAPFQRFCAGWLEQIDAEHELPGRKKYRRTIDRARRAGALTRRRST